MPSNSSNTEKTRESNPHWKGYCFLILSSLINFSAISNVPEHGNFFGYKIVALCFGIFTFCLSVFVLFFDYVDIFVLYKIWDGKLEGYVLSFCVLWWIAGVAYTTQVNGIGYVVMNVYVTSWLSLVCSVYTLNSWSAKRDLLSIQELTGVSVTLKAWYILFISSLIVAGTTINVAIIDMYGISWNDMDNFIGLVLGVFSSAVSLVFILLHYQLIEVCTKGGWHEFVAALIMIALWTIGCAVLTQEGAIGSTIVGRGCPTFFQKETEGGNFQTDLFQPNWTDTEDECRVLVSSINTTDYVVLNGTMLCSEFIQYTRNRETHIPGSNLYVSVWMCLAASIQIALRWKAQQAVQLAARAHQSRQEEPDKALEFSDDDVDLDDFVDAED